jgi:hypothetical protein
MNAPIDPDRLTRLIEDAVGDVRPRIDALDLIRYGARRRQVVHRVIAAAAALAVIAGGATAYATVRGAARSPPGPPLASRHPTGQPRRPCLPGGRPGGGTGMSTATGDRTARVSCRWVRAS